MTRVTDQVYIKCLFDYLCQIRMIIFNGCSVFNGQFYLVHYSILTSQLTINQFPFFSLFGPVHEILVINPYAIGLDKQIFSTYN